MQRLHIILLLVTNMQTMNIALRKIMILVLFAGVVFAGIYLFQTRDPSIESAKQEKVTEKIRVTTSFYPYAYLVEKVGGKYVEVITLTPPGAEAHDFEPTARDIALLEKSSLVVLNGGGVESYEESLRQAYEGKNKLIVALGQPYIVGRDPHVWLDPVIMGKMARDLAEMLSEIDSERKNIFIGNAANLQKEMNIINDTYVKATDSCSKKTIFTAHTAFGYLASRYGFTQVGIAGIHPEEEPSAQELGKITDEIKKTGAKYVLLEDMAPTKLSEIVAEEAGVTLLILSPIESITESELAKGESYTTKQMQNAATIKTALECL